MIATSSNSVRRTVLAAAVALTGASAALGQQLVDNIKPAPLPPAAATAALLPPDQCRSAILIGTEIMERNAISGRLASSFERFRLSNCRLDTVFERETDIDNRAFGEFRVRLIALRMSAANSPAALAQK